MQRRRVTRSMRVDISDGIGGMDSRAREVAQLAAIFAREAVMLASELDARTGRRSRALQACAIQASDEARRAEAELLLGRPEAAYTHALAGMTMAATALAEAKVAVATYQGVSPRP